MIGAVSDIKRWKARAEKARAMAERMEFEGVALTLREVADAYEKMVAEAEAAGASDEPFPRKTASKS